MTEDDMVTIAENATFNRKALLGDDVEEISKLERPGDNYIKAGYLIWLAMRASNFHQDNTPMVGDNDRPGRTVTGMGPAQAIRLLWPNISNAEMDRSRLAITRHLKVFNNAVCLEQGRQHTLAKWWVSDVWQEPVFTPRRGAGMARPKPYKPRAKKTKPDMTASVDKFIEESNASPAEAAPTDTTESEPYTVIEKDQSGVTVYDLSQWLDSELLALSSKIQDMLHHHLAALDSQVTALMAENKELRSKLEAIKKAIS